MNINETDKNQIPPESPATPPPAGTPGVTTVRPLLRPPRLKSDSFGIKVALIAVLLLCFQIPLSMIRSTVNERQWMKADVEEEIVHSWGGEAALGGPVLVLPREKKIDIYNESGTVMRTDTVRDQIYLLPDTLDVRAVSTGEEKFRGIYSVPVYTVLLEGNGLFSLNEIFERYDTSEILWEEATVQFSYPSLKGMKKIAPFVWEGEELSFQPGRGHQSFYAGTMAVPVSMGRPDGNNDSYAFQFSQEIQGGRALRFLPLGKETRITLESDWPAPSFTGYYLPSSKELREDGFSAEWEINYLSRSIPQSWTSGDYTLEQLPETEFGVRFFPAVTSYDKTSRTLKYGLLFLVLPFITFFLFEVIRKHRIHPVQYLLAGTGNVLFYLLLLSLSEQMAFNGAYLLSALAVTGLLTFYAVSVLKARRSGLAMIPVLGLSYLYLYFVLQSEDYALLMGSGGLFVVVALVMYLTRKVEWYRKED